MLGSFGGVPIIWSIHALEATEARLFPASRHRSARIRKKLIRRFGAEFQQRPCIWKTPDGFVAHPSLKADFDAALRREADRTGRPAWSPAMLRSESAVLMKEGLWHGGPKRK